MADITLTGSLRTAATLSVAALLTACMSGPEGRFAPDCIAHAGDRIDIRDGRFTWDKFTDVVELDDDGNRVEPFPGFPKTGSFDVRKDVVTFTADDNTPLPDYYMLEHRGRQFLLTWEQNEAVGDGEEMPACALVFEPAEG